MNPDATISVTPALAVLVSLAAAVCIVASARRPNLREAWTLGAAVVKFGLVFSLLPGALAGRVAECHVLEISPGLDLALRADPLGVFFALVASGLWIVTSVFSIGYMRGLDEHSQTRYFASFAICLSATIGLAFAANLLTFTVFYEILTVATYPLVIHKETPEAISAGRKYLVYTLSAGLALIVASAWTWQLTGSLEFRPGGFLSTAHAGASTLSVLFVLFIASAGVKAGLMPLHSWLPTAMVAPTPVSALLHAVAVVKAGVFSVIRIVGFVFGPETLREIGAGQWLAIAAAATMLLASLIAFNQDNLKRRLAYSTIGHLSYIILGAALLTPSSFAGSMLHLASHATMKITLFFCAGAIYVNLHKERISDLAGVGRQMPWTMAAFAVGSLGLAGIPPVNGFLSKWYLGVGGLEAGQPVLLGLLLLSGLLNAGYFFPILHTAFFRSALDGDDYREASWLMVGPLVLTAVFSVLLGLFPGAFFRFYETALLVSRTVLAGGAP